MKVQDLTEGQTVTFTVKNNKEMGTGTFSILILRVEEKSVFFKHITDYPTELKKEQRKGHNVINTWLFNC